MKKFIIILIISLSAITLASQSVMAQDIGFQKTKDYGDQSFLDTIAGKAFFKTDDVKDQAFIDTTLGQLIAIFIGFLGVLFLAFIIYSGFQWMTAGGNEEKVEKSKTRIKNAVIGLSLVVLSYVITNIVIDFVYKSASVQTSCNEIGGSCVINDWLLDDCEPPYSDYGPLDCQGQEICCVPPGT